MRLYLNFIVHITATNFRKNCQNYDATKIYQYTK